MLINPSEQDSLDSGVEAELGVVTVDIVDPQSEGADEADDQRWEAEDGYRHADQQVVTATAPTGTSARPVCERETNAMADPGFYIRQG